ncbi:hypothetical protein PO878_19975 [Iamia majanohamensis]|uniref:DUF5709 domain-containing protein n=1 Tax=Iamia majanohamensis TaxID=467976 RepID=A0AAF0BV62_9ACTN|nr:hypothetical protein [Iamia majanohamensis]WCO66773.1 hypothetical protein PO878_19975 [Iamia majanohamensis]
MASDQPGEPLDDDRTSGAPYPPEHPLGADAYGTTAAEEAAGEPLTERVSREEPDEVPPEDEAPELVAPDEGVRADSEEAEVAAAVTEDEATLAEGDPLAGDPSTRDVVQEREGATPAEEAAVRVEDEPG